METPLPETRPRRLPLEGAYNFRDLGGYPTRDGRETRWGRVYRSDALHELTDTDRKHLSGVGLTSVVDLRGKREAEAVGIWPTTLDREGNARLRYVNYPVIPPESYDDPTVPIASRDGRAERYLWYLDVGAAAVVSSVEAIAAASPGAVVFHCAAGKDRTGILAALTLDAVGVERDAIVADYAATTEVLAKVLTRLRSHPVYRDGVDSVVRERHDADAEVMEQFLDGLGARHGGAEAWLRRAGVRSETLEALHTNLVG